VQRLAREDPQAFLCHFYNIYFAHSAGGRMIGKKVSEMCLDGAQLQFYQYDGELKELLEKVPLLLVSCDRRCLYCQAVASHSICLLCKCSNHCCQCWQADHLFDINSARTH
jgi:hypothetical protein